MLPTPGEAPPWAWAVGVVFGVVTLAGLVAWWRSASRAALWVAVVVRALSGLLPVLGLADPIPDWMKVATLITLVVTAVGIILVRPALGRRAGEPARAT
ncbi:hypothetical protein [Actinomycetospora flava]|uniref:Uncharacterized protein n=1 Tax=Actinomycetospora flava TaxID=3129232 RepID=A0ABU8MDC7_9PSEU